ncbi:hypothetical protein [Nocardioides sp. InS609-2]|uniref:hypothetical protein n=1 Tax=Nocardioides sp. InS609-2 TaxID=2760705 RepID=UPI0020C00E94|nr:hypothetical protein [Nocardioides sp. InS609-2]
MAGKSLTDAADPNGYACPFCPVIVSEKSALVSYARLRFEGHLDVHMAVGDQLRVAS